MENEGKRLCSVVSGQQRVGRERPLPGHGKLPVLGRGAAMQLLTTWWQQGVIQLMLCGRVWGFGGGEPPKELHLPRRPEDLP